MVTLNRPDNIISTFMAFDIVLCKVYLCTFFKIDDTPNGKTFSRTPLLPSFNKISIKFINFLMRTGGKYFVALSKANLRSVTYYIVVYSTNSTRYTIYIRPFFVITENEK